MEKNVEARLKKLQTIRLDNGTAVVWVGENPVQDLDQAIIMTQRAGLMYRFSMDGRELQYRISEEAPVLTVPLAKACDTLCALVESNYFGVDPTPEIEEWEPTPEYAAELEKEPEPEEEVPAPDTPE
jgi:hypothetical protein